MKLEVGSSDDWGKGRTFVMCEETGLCFHSAQVI